MEIVVGSFERLDASAKKMQAAFDLALERFEKASDWRRFLPATRREVAGCVAEASQSLLDMDALGAVSKEDIAELRTRLSAFRTAYSSHQVHFLASSTENRLDYGTSLRHVLMVFAEFSQAVKRTATRMK